MKYLLVLMSVLFVNVAMAGGKLEVSGNYFKDKKDFRPKVGLAIYQPLVLGVAYNGWTGVGEARSANEKLWFTTKHAIEFSIQKVTLGAGFQLDYDKVNKVEDSLFVKAAYQLW